MAVGRHGRSFHRIVNDGGGRNKKAATSLEESAAETVVSDPLPYAGITQVRFEGSSDRSDSQPRGPPSSG
jgi:hypothetical protein